MHDAPISIQRRTDRRLPPSTWSAPKRVLKTSRWAIPLRIGRIAVADPTAGANCSIASSSAYDLVATRTRIRLAHGGPRQHGHRRNGEITVGADDAQPIAGELLRAPRAHQERNIAVRAGQAGTEIAPKSSAPITRTRIYGFVLAKGVASMMALRATCPKCPAPIPASCGDVSAVLSTLSARISEKGSDIRPQRPLVRSKDFCTTN